MAGLSGLLMFDVFVSDFDAMGSVLRDASMTGLTGAGFDFAGSALRGACTAGLGTAAFAAGLVGLALEDFEVPGFGFFLFAMICGGRGSRAAGRV